MASVTTARTSADEAIVVGLAAGGLDAATELHTELEWLAGSGERRVVVDLSAAPELDLTVVGVLLASLRRLNDADGLLVLLVPDDARLDVADDALRLDRHFRVERSLADALAAAGEAGR